MEQDTHEWFDYVLNSKWVLLAPNRLVEAKRDDNGQWTIGDIITNDQEILRARPKDAKEPLGFHLIHQGWKTVILRRYRPMIYFCAFCAEEIFQCVELAIKALLQFGKWQHEIVIMTEKDRQTVLQERLEYLNLGNRLHIVGTDYTADSLDWCIARYRVNEYPILQQAQPLIYCDTDTLCNRELDPLLIQIIDSWDIYACKEGLIGEGNPASDGVWYGWRLMQGDNVPFNPNDRGFSAGILVFQNAQSVAEIFDLIIRATYGYMDVIGYRHLFYDQGFANYILFKYKRVEIELLSKWVHLYRISEVNPSPPNTHERYRLGIVHFLAVPLKTKLEIMQRYFNAMQGLSGNYDHIKTIF